jgi:hypothetical protein
MAAFEGRHDFQSALEIVIDIATDTPPYVTVSKQMRSFSNET